MSHQIALHPHRTRAIPPRHPLRVLTLVVLLIASSAAPLWSWSGNVRAMAGIGPDLVVESVEVTPPDPTEGDAVVVVARIANLGNEPTAGFDVSFSLSTGETLGSVRVPLLAAGEATRVESPAWASTPGARDAIVTADARDEVDETAEGNNDASQAFDVEALPRDDLAVTTLVAEPATPVEGEALRLTATIENLGTREANASLVFTIDGVWAGGVDSIILPPGGAAVLTSDASTVEAGLHEAVARAILASGEKDASPGNDALVLAVTVDPTPRPDVAVVGVSPEPAAPKEGEETVFTATLENRGNEPALHVVTSFRVDGTDIGSRIVDTLAPGARIAVRSDSWHATAGSHEVNVAVNDSASPEDGASEPNNEWEAPIAVAALTPPDLVVTDLRLDPPHAAAAEIVTALATVTNAGDHGAEAFTVIFSRDGGIVLGTQTVTSLAPGASTTLSVDWNATEGDHTIRVDADDLQSVEEANEDNNAATTTATVREREAPQLPDLVVPEVRVTPAHPAPGEAVRFTATIVNQGEALAGTFTVTFLVDGQELESMPVLLLPAGDSATVSSAEILLSKGVHTVTVVADAEGSLTESEERNNDGILAFSVASQPTPLSPNLLMEQVLVDPASPEDGYPATFMATVRNTGESPATSFVVTFQVDGVVVEDVPVVLLDAGATVTLTASWTAVGGQRVLTAIADSYGTVVETDEADNAASRSFAVRMADLRVTSISPQPTPTRHGDVVDLLVGIENVDAFAYREGEVVREGFEVLDQWSSEESGGGSFMNGASAGYTTERAASGEVAAYVEFAGGGDGSDFGATYLRTTVDFAKLDHVSLQFLLDEYAHDGSFWDGLEAGFWFWGVDAEGHEVTPRYAYWLSAWSKSSDTREPRPNTILVHDKPAMDVWIPFTGEPTSDFGIDWSGTERVEVRLYAAGGGTSGDAFRMLFDDLELAGSEAVSAGANASASTTRVLIDDGSSWTVETPELAPGEDVTMVFGPWQATGGDYQVAALADADDDVRERDESNNALAEAVHVIHPDLEVTALQATPSEPLPHEETTFTATVTNIGGRAPPSSVAFFVDDVPLGTVPIPETSFGDVVQVQSPTWSGEGGDHMVTATVDPEDTIHEEDEENNDHAVIVHVALPDLHPGALVSSVPDAVEGEPVTFTATVVNTGRADSAPFTVRFLMDGDVLADVGADALGGGEVVDVSAPPWAATVGLHDVTVVLDPANVVPEEDEDDNVATMTFLAGPADPDLAVTAIEAGDAVHGGTVTFTGTVTNRMYPVDTLSIEDDFSDASRWSRFTIGGLGFSRLTTTDHTSPPTAAEVGFGPWENCCRTDLRQDFPMDRLDHIGISYKFADYAHTPGSDDSMAAGISFIGLDANGHPLVGPYNYHFATWYTFSDTPPAAPHIKIVHHTPPMNQWLDFQANPTDDFNIDWTGVTTIRFVVLTSASGIDGGDRLHMYADDLRLGASGASEDAPLWGVPSPATTVAVHVDGKFVEELDVPALEAGESFTFATTPWPVTGGDHEVEARVDPHGLVPDVDETNDALTAGFRVRQADLTSGEITLSPVAPLDGDDVMFSVAIANQGDDASAASSVRLTLDGLEIGLLPIPALMAGESAIVSASPWRAVGGHHLVTAVIDPEDLVPEEREDNNLATREFLVQRSNLAAEGIAVEPVSPEHGDVVHLGATVTNLATGIHVIDDFSDASRWSRFTVGGLGFSRITTNDFTSPPSAAEVGFGPWENCCRTDLRQDFPMDRLDHVSISYKFTQYAHTPGSDDSMAAGIDLRGLDANGNTIVGPYNYQFATWYKFGDTPPAAPHIKIVHHTPPMNQWLDFETNPTDDFNIDWTGVTTIRLSVLTSASGIDGGDRLHMYADDLELRAGSLESAPATDVTVRFLVDGMAIGEGVIDRLEPGETVTVAGPAWTAVGGDHVLNVVADPDDVIAETDEADNVREQALHVRQADLVVDTVTLTPEDPHTSDRVTFLATVRNQGDAPSAPMTLRYVLDPATDGGVLDEVAVPALDPGAALVIASREWKARVGPHEILVMADALDDVAEILEDNNGFTVAFAVDPVADLRADAVTLTPAEPVQGAETSFTVDVSNIGDAGAGAFTVAFFVDGELVETQHVQGIPGGDTIAVTSNTWRATLGLHTIRVVVDWTDAIQEGSETNNEVSKDFLVL